MNLQELKTMIAEEFANFNEQEVAVSDADVDATGGDDAEAQLEEIYEMLKAYFEGGAGDEEEAADMADDMADELEDEGPVEAPDALQERFKKLANIIKG
tara:strand:- start:235 stop:531 length:297 start_codon:yes stop_codon:yes gene_type:complete